MDGVKRRVPLFPHHQSIATLAQQPHLSVSLPSLPHLSRAFFSPIPICPDPNQTASQLRSYNSNPPNMPQLPSAVSAEALLHHLVNPWCTGGARAEGEDALAVLVDQRAQIELISSELLGELQRALFSLGLPKDPDQWHRSVPRVIRDLNIEYRHNCKVDIIQGARKIRPKHASFEDSELRTLHASRVPQMSRSLTKHYAGIVPTIKVDVSVLNEHVQTPKKLRSTYKAALEVVTLPQADVRIFAMRLSKPAFLKANILGVQPLFVQLRELYVKRINVEK
ncbi:hypothetical protein LXA43DRAFT_1097055 [Ganoderma leucocontextum]|nr:hypothetical protein LXA43DRAFT_1097055 [Ganoderma leucocontextum]